MSPLINIPLGVNDGLSREWNEAYESGDKELTKKLTRECWFFRLYCERTLLN